MPNGNLIDTTNIIGQLLFGRTIDPVSLGVRSGKKSSKNAQKNGDEIKETLKQVADQGLIGLIANQSLSNEPTPVKTTVEEKVETPVVNAVGGEAPPLEDSVGKNVEIVNKIIEQNRKKNAQEAVQQLGPQGALQAAQQLDQQEQQPVSQPQSPPLSRVRTPQNFLEGLFQQAGIDPKTGVVKTPGLFNIVPGAPDFAGAQELVGETPLSSKDKIDLRLDILKQQSDEAKILEDQQNEFFKRISSPLSGAKDVGLVDRTITALNDVNSLLGIETDAEGNVSISNTGILRNPNILSKNRQALKRARDQFVRSALRLESGAAIGEKEEKDFQRTFGFDVGLSSFLKNSEVIARNLVQLKNNFTSQRDNLNPNSEARQFRIFLEKKGKSRAEQKRIMAQAGMLG